MNRRKTTVFKAYEPNEPMKWWVSYDHPSLRGFRAFRDFDTWPEAIKFAFSRR